MFYAFKKKKVKGLQTRSGSVEGPAGRVLGAREATEDRHGGSLGRDRAGGESGPAPPFPIWRRCAEPCGRSAIGNVRRGQRVTTEYVAR